MDMNQLMKQAQKLQKDLEKKQQALQELSFEGSSGGGCVHILIKGNYSLEKVTISKNCPRDDIETLEDMIQAAFNNALEKVRKESEKVMNGMPQKFPGMPPFF